MTDKSSVLTINTGCVRVWTKLAKGKTQKATHVAAAMDLMLQVRQKDRTQVYPLVIIMVQLDIRTVSVCTLSALKSLTPWVEWSRTSSACPCIDKTLNWLETTDWAQTMSQTQLITTFTTKHLTNSCGSSSGGDFRQSWRFPPGSSCCAETNFVFKTTWVQNLTLPGSSCCRTDIDKILVTSQ